MEAAMTRAGFPAVSPPALLNCEAKGSGTVNEENEHEAPDEAVEAPTTEEMAAEEAEHEEAVHEAEQAVDEPAQEDSAPRDEKEIEKALKKVAAARTTYANRLSAILGEDFQAFVPCELCSHFVSGFRFPQVPPPEIVGRVRAAIGLAERENFRQSPFHIRCDTCGGLGEVLTDSLVTNQETVPCPTCGARGFVQNPDAPVPGYTVTVPGQLVEFGNGESTTTAGQGIDPAEAQRRMQQAIAQAQGHAVGPTADG